jgi:pimeloyl-ACP methyl ester carboxylesterase
VGTCFGRLNANPGYTRQFSLTNGAHDLKLLLERTPRRGRTFLYGVSDGTQLVLRTVALGAPKIDGIVLDSLVALQDDDKADLSRRSLVTDKVRRQILAACDANRRCSAREVSRSKPSIGGCWHVPKRTRYYLPQLQAGTLNAFSAACSIFRV